MKVKTQEVGKASETRLKRVKSESETDDDGEKEREEEEGIAEEKHRVEEHDEEEIDLVFGHDIVDEVQGGGVDLDEIVISGVVCFRISVIVALLVRHSLTVSDRRRSGGFGRRERAGKTGWLDRLVVGEVQGQGRQSTEADLADLWRFALDVEVEARGVKWATLTEVEVILLILLGVVATHADRQAIHSEFLEDSVLVT